jgi:hypothetical protein
MMSSYFVPLAYVAHGLVHLSPGVLILPLLPVRSGLLATAWLPRTCTALPHPCEFKYSPLAEMAASTLSKSTLIASFGRLSDIPDCPRCLIRLQL